MPPTIWLDSPCTSEAQAISPSTRPSTCRSAEAETSPLIVTSDPITEKVELGACAIGLAAAGLPRSAGFFENIGSGLQNRARIDRARSEEHTSELQSLMRISYAVVCLKKKK